VEITALAAAVIPFRGQLLEPARLRLHAYLQIGLRAIDSAMGPRRQLNRMAVSTIESVVGRSTEASLSIKLYSNKAAGSVPK